MAIRKYIYVFTFEAYPNGKIRTFDITDFNVAAPDPSKIIEVSTKSLLMNLPGFGNSDWPIYVDALGRKIAYCHFDSPIYPFNDYFWAINLDDAADPIVPRPFGTSMAYPHTWRIDDLYLYIGAGMDINGTAPYLIENFTLEPGLLDIIPIFNSTLRFEFGTALPQIHDFLVTAQQLDGNYYVVLAAEKQLFGGTRYGLIVYQCIGNDREAGGTLRWDSFVDDTVDRITGGFETIQSVAIDEVNQILYVGLETAAGGVGIAKVDFSNPASLSRVGADEFTYLGSDTFSAERIRYSAGKLYVKGAYNGNIGLHMFDCSGAITYLDSHLDGSAEQTLRRFVIEPGTVYCASSHEIIAILERNGALTTAYQHKVAPYPAEYSWSIFYQEFDDSISDNEGPEVINRNPVGGATGVSRSGHILFDIYDLPLTGAIGVDLSTIIVTFGGEIAYISSVFTPRYSAASSVTLVNDPDRGAAYEFDFLRDLPFEGSSLLVEVSGSDLNGNTFSVSYSFTFEVIPAIDFTVSSIEAINTSQIRVTFSEDPQMISRAIYNDALNPANYKLTKSSGDGGILYVNDVEEDTSASVILNIAPRFFDADTLYTLTVSNIAADDPLLDPITSWTSETFYGIISNSDDRNRTIALEKQGDLDFHYIPGSGLSVTPDGDYGLHAGMSAMKKRIIRRLLTPNAGFLFLEDYGAKPGLKNVNREVYGDLIVASYEREILKEEGVKDVTISLTSDNAKGVLYIHVSVVTTSGNEEFSFPYEDQ